MINQEEIITKLRECLDPELGINIVDLGLIYGVIVDQGKVRVLMTLTTPACPMESYFTKTVKDKVKSLKGVKDVRVELTFDPPWTPQKLSDTLQEELDLPKN